MSPRTCELRRRGSEIAAMMEPCAVRGLSEVGEELGLSRERVRQIQNMAFVKIEARLKEYRGRILAGTE